MQADPDWSKYAPPPLEAMQLTEAWKLFHDHYWSADPLGPEPRAMGLKILNFSRRKPTHSNPSPRLVAYVMINPDTGKVFVKRNNRISLQRGLSFPIAYKIMRNRRFVDRGI